MRHNMLPLLRIFSHVSGSITFLSSLEFLTLGYRIVSMESDRVVGRWWSDSVSCIGNQLFRRSLRVDTRIYRRRKEEGRNDESNEYLMISLGLCPRSSSRHFSLTHSKDLSLLITNSGMQVEVNSVGYSVY